MRLTRLRNLAVAFDPAQRRLRATLRGLAAGLPAADRILDLGSGRAPYADMFPHRAYFTADLLSRADVRCDAESLPFAGASFDLVLCTEVLEHVPDPHGTLQEIRRVLRRNGTLVLSTPLTWGVHEPLDFHRWTDSGLRNLLLGHGFAVDALKPRGGVLLCLSALLLIIPWQLFGGSSERSAWQTVLFAATYTLLFPFAILVAALDRLDRRRHFTQGYVARCRPTT